MNISDFNFSFVDYETANLQRSLYVPVEYAQEMLNDCYSDQNLYLALGLLVGVLLGLSLAYLYIRKGKL